MLKKILLIFSLAIILNSCKAFFSGLGNSWGDQVYYIYNGREVYETDSNGKWGKQVYYIYDGREVYETDSNGKWGKQVYYIYDGREVYEVSVVKIKDEQFEWSPPKTKKLYRG